MGKGTNHGGLFKARLTQAINDGETCFTHNSQEYNTKEASYVLRMESGTIMRVWDAVWGGTESTGPQPGEIVQAYIDGAPEDVAIPLHNQVMAFNWGGLLPVDGSANPWYSFGDGVNGGPPYNTEHQFLLRHPSSYFTKELWDFMRRPGLEIEVKACDPWTDIHYTSGGYSSNVHHVNRYRLKDTDTGEYWNWGSQKNFDFGMANGEWSSFVPFGTTTSLMAYTLDENAFGYNDLRDGLQTIADGGGAPASFGVGSFSQQWVNLIFASFGYQGGGGNNIGYGGTYNSETNTFNVSTPSMSSYVAQDPYYGGTLPTTYAEMWSSTQAIASAAALEGVPAQNISSYNSPGGFPWFMTVFYPNLQTLHGGDPGHGWIQGYIGYLTAGSVFAVNEPANPNLSEFFDEDSPQYRYYGAPLASALNQGGDEAPNKGVKSVKSPDPSLIVEHASSDHDDEHGVPINNDFHTYTLGGMSSWLVPLVGDHWYIPYGTVNRVKQDAPDTYICGHLPPYFT
jgi:hypothetical protein